jgi:hypothetical protein
VVLPAVRRRDEGTAAARAGEDDVARLVTQPERSPNSGRGSREIHDADGVRQLVDDPYFGARSSGHGYWLQAHRNREGVPQGSVFHVEHFEPGVRRVDREQARSIGREREGAHRIGLEVDEIRKVVLPRSTLDRAEGRPWRRSSRDASHVQDAEVHAALAIRSATTWSVQRGDTLARARAVAQAGLLSLQTVAAEGGSAFVVGRAAGHHAVESRRRAHLTAKGATAHRRSRHFAQAATFAVYQADARIVPVSVAAPARDGANAGLDRRVSAAGGAMRFAARIRFGRLEPELERILGAPRGALDGHDYALAGCEVERLRVVARVCLAR